MVFVLYYYVERFFIAHKNILLLISKLLAMSTKKATKKETQRKVFLTGSVVDNSNPLVSVFYDAMVNKLMLCVRTTLTMAILKEVLNAFNEVINLSTKIEVYNA